MLIGCLLASIDEEEEVEPQQAVETVTYLTDYELSQLYSVSDDERIKGNIIEMTYPEAQLLLQVARQEGGETLIGQLWVMRTIINRVECDERDFGDTIGEVIFGEGQFEVVIKGTYLEADVNDNSHLALAALEGGWDETKGALFFESNSNSKDSWHSKNLTFIKEVEGNRYYR